MNTGSYLQNRRETLKDTINTLKVEITVYEKELDSVEQMIYDLELKGMNREYENSV